MQIKKSDTRTVLLAGSYVFKFPRLFHLFRILRKAIELIPERKWDLIRINSYWKWRDFYEGIRQNFSEYRCWRATKANFLAPTFFSIGIINVQKREKGDIPFSKELRIAFQKLPKEAEEERLKIDPHYFSSKNFIKNTEGMRLIDYGDKSPDLKFVNFLIRWQKELSSAFYSN